MSFLFHPPLYELDSVEPGNRHLLRQLLSRDPHEADRPLSMIQRAVFQEDDVALLGQFDLVYNRGGHLRRTGLLDGDADHVGAAAILALRLGTDAVLKRAVDRVSRARRLRHDAFMGLPVTLEIRHFPNAAMLAWDMDQSRMKKLLANNEDSVSEGLKRNNPIGALGTLVIRRSHSAHDRLAAMADRKDAEARLRCLLGMHATSFEIGASRSVQAVS